MDVLGRVIIPPRFSFGLEFLEGRAPVMIGKRWRYIDHSGAPAFAGEFGNAERFSEGRAFVIAAPRKYGYIDIDGNIVIKGKYRWADHFSEGRALVYAGGYAGFVDSNGVEAIGLQYKAACGFSEGLAAVLNDKKWGYVDRSGEVRIPFQFEQPFASPFRDGLAGVRDPAGDTGFIDPKGATVIAPRFRFAYGFSEGLAAVQVGERWGYIDTGGDFVIEPRFDRAYPFSEGLAAVNVRSDNDQSMIGFIGRSGEMVIHPQFQLGFRFHDGLCWTETRETCGYINPSGEYVWSCPKLETGMMLRL